MVWAALRDTICRPDCLPDSIGAPIVRGLTSDSQPIFENENRPDSGNLSQCNRFLSCRADILKEAAKSIKIRRIGYQNTRAIHAPILSDRPEADKT